MLYLPRYLGVKKMEERNLDSIVEKTDEMEIDAQGDVKRKRAREEEEQGSMTAVIKEAGPERRQSKRIKRSKTKEDVNLA